MRNLRDPLYGKIPSKPISIESGGTGADNIVEAIASLGGIPISKINDPGGPLGLTLTGQIPPEVIDYNEINTQTTLKGPESVSFNETVTFKITNYDIAKTYNVTKIGDGSVSIVGDTITYTAPNAKSFAGDGFNIASQLGGENVPSRRVELQLDAEQSVNKPSITDPNKNGKTGLSTEYTFASSTFSFTGSAQTHLSSDWEIATSSNFGATNVFSTTNDTSHLIEWTPVGILDPSTVYYVRVRYKGSASGYSLWSNPIQFTTGIDYPNTLRQQLRHSDPEVGDLFGWNVALSGDNTTLVVAAPNKNNPNVDMGQFGASGFIESFGTVSTYIADARNWFGAVSMYGYIYACAYGTGADNGAVVAFNESTGAYAGVFGSTNSRTGIATRKDNQGVAVELWECGTGFIGSWHGGMGDFYPHPNIPNYQFRGICVIGDDIYLCVYGGLIYSFNRPDTQSTRTLAVFHNEVGLWSGVYDINGTLYATTYSTQEQGFVGNNGLVLKFEGNLSSGRTRISNDHGYWTGLAYHHGRLFACTNGGAGNLFVLNVGGTAFDLVGNSPPATWNGLFVAEDTVCVVQSNGYIYKIPWYTKGILGGTFAGAAYVFKKVNNTWTQQAKLLPDDSLGLDFFAEHVCISHDGNTILAWSFRRPAYEYADGKWGLKYLNQGKLYVFRYLSNVWEQSAVIDPVRNRVFHRGLEGPYATPTTWECTSLNSSGTILAIAYSYVLVNEGDDPHTGLKQGYVYIYTKNDNEEWSLRDTIVVTDQSITAQLSGTCNLIPVLNPVGDTLYLGVPGYDRMVDGVNRLAAGKIDIYTYNGTTWDKSITPILNIEDRAENHHFRHFGASLDISRDGRYLVATTFTGRTNAVTTCIYHKDELQNWILDKKFEWPSYGTSFATLAVDSNGRTIVTGIPRSDNMSEGGAMIVKNRRDNWPLDEYTDIYSKFIPNLTDIQDLYGNSVAINSSGDTAFIGSPGDNMINPVRDNVGKVYIYSK